MTDVIDMETARKRIEAERYYEAHRYIPGGLVLAAMQWFGEDDPQEAWDRLWHELYREMCCGDEEVCREKAASLVVDLAEEIKRHDEALI